MTDTDKIDIFARGDWLEVPPTRIEAELSSLWRAAAAKSRPVTRACLWNLVVRVTGDADFKYAKQLIDDISKALPARVVVMKPEPGDDEGQGTIRAFIEANWRRAEGGQGASGSDEVTLIASGRATLRLTSLVRSLMIPDAPTAMMWVGATPAESAPVRELLREVDRLVVDSRKFASESDLGALAKLVAAQPELELVDLSWLGISPLRGLCAALFDPPHDPTPLELLERVRVVSGVVGVQSRGLLALGWLAARLGWRDYQRVEGASDLRRWRATRRAGGSVTIELGTDTSRASHGVVALELEAGGRRWSLTRDQKCIFVRAPSLPDRLQPARSHSDAELTATALGPHGRNPVFRAALGEAARLVDAK